MVIFRWLYFYFINRGNSYRWVAAVSWLNYLILAVDLWSSSAQHSVKRAVDPDTESSPENLPEAMDDRDEWWEIFREIFASSATWWLWHIYIYIYIYIKFSFIRSIDVRNTIVTPWRCPRCNCYRRRKWTRRPEFKSWTRLIAFHIALILLWI